MSVSRASHPRDESFRVLLVHNRYQQPGGEDVVFEAEAKVLSHAGHPTARLVMDNDAIPADMSFAQRTKLAMRTVWSTTSAAVVRNAIRRFRPDVLHAHNTFPLWSSSIFSAARREGVATVQTLHNYRLVCPSADLYRDHRPCEDCVGKPVAWPSVVHACYRGSRSQTAVVAGMLAVNRARRTWQRDVDAFIALTSFARERLISGGVPEARLHVKPNFVHPDPGPGPLHRRGFLFAGRLHETKGVLTLIEALRSLGSDAPDCRIAGSGPLEVEVRRAAEEMPGLRFLGHISREMMFNEMRSSIAVVVPSLWYEGFPMTVAEAFATSTPVIASNLGSLAEIVGSEHGVLVEPGDSNALAGAMVWGIRNAPAMAVLGAAARRTYETDYSADASLSHLRTIYRAAIENRAMQR